MSLVLAVDIGTGSCRCALYDEDLRRLSMSAVEISSSYPHPGWAEQDPERVFSTVIEAVAQTLKRCGKSPESVDVLTLDGALHTLMGLDNEGLPVTPVLTWEDARAWEITQRWLRANIGQQIYRATGCPLHPMYAPPKIAWWKKNHPDLFKRVKNFVSLKAYVIFRLTGELLEDQATASGSGLLNLETLDWDEDVMRLAGISREKLAPVLKPTDKISGLTRETVELTGLGTSTSVIIGSSDAAMSSLGSGTITPNQTTVMIGTSGAVRRLVEHPALDSQARTFCYYFGNNLWFAGGAINNGGVVLRWFRDHLGKWAIEEAKGLGKSEYAMLSECAARVPPGSEGLLFLPFLAGERSPFWNPNMRGALVGLSLHHGQGHMIRALMEGVSYRIRSVIEPLEDLLGPSAEIRVTGGFARSHLWPQVLSNVLGRELRILKEPEGSLLGAAAFACRAVGMLDSFTVLLEKNPVSKIIHPDSALQEIYTKGFEKYMRIYWKLKEEFEPPSLGDVH